LTVTWTAPSSNGGTPIVNYNIYVDGALIGTAPGTTTQFTATAPALVLGASQTITVAAVNSIGVGALSESQLVIVGQTPYKPNVPTKLSADASTISV
jgi:hypothetical protein